MTEGEQREINQLRNEVRRLQAVNVALMERVERSVDSAGDAYTLFENNIRMRGVVDRRTQELEAAVGRLRAEADRRRTSERELARLAAVAENTDNIVVILDADARIEWTNRALEKTFGVKADDIKNFDIRQWLDQADMDEAVRRRIRTAFDKARPFDERITAQDDQGEDVILQFSCQPIRDATGDHGGFVAVGRNITLEYAQEHAVQAAFARLRKITSCVPGVVYQYRVDPDGSDSLPYASEGIRELFGLDPIDVIDGCSPIWNKLHPEDRPKVHQAVVESAENLTPWRIQFRRILDDGAVRWLQGQANPERQPDGATVWYGHITDITDQREAEERLRIAIDAARAGVWDWIVNDKVIITNDDYWTMIGETPPDGPVDDAEFFDRLHPNDVKPLQDIIAPMNEEEFHFNTQFRLRCADGSWRWIQSTGAVAEREPSGAVRRLIGQHIDVHEQRTARERAEEANRSKSEFLANMSHEIRTPMTAILGFADLLMEINDGPEAARRRAEIVRTIRSNGDHLLTVINDILDMSRIEAGKMRVEHEKCCPLRIVGEVASLMRQRAAGKGVTLNVRYDSDIPESVESDPTRLRQILINLVGNAVKFTEVGGVTIAVRFESRPATLRFDVIDTGIGMTHEQRHAITTFSAFNQADASVTRRFGGAGLGLRISHSFAALLGGDIEVDSEPGVGSTFSLTINPGDVRGVAMLSPRQAAARAEELQGRDAHHARTPHGKPLAGMRILLAEDGPDNQRLISHHLKRAGAQVIVADNGAIALEQIERQKDADAPVQLILMDMQMPELDGYAATRRLRERGCNTPVVALTAHAMAGDREKCLEAGCDEYLVKPIDRDRLIDACAQWTIRRAA